VKTLGLAATGLAAAMLLLVAGLLLDGLRDDAQPSDVAIVLGSQVLPDGTPSARLQARLSKGAELYQRGLVRQVLVSGGTGREGFNEARVMASWLFNRHKLPTQAVLLDEHGNTTADTARNCAAIMHAHGYTSAVAVTQYFHVTRSKLALRRAGVPTVHGAHPEYFEWRDLYSTAREAVALPAYWLAPR
jgi:vancomycin permeability regulator SanA